jgi:hypothetical protein
VNAADLRSLLPAGGERNNRASNSLYIANKALTLSGRDSTRIDEASVKSAVIQSGIVIVDMTGPLARRRLVASLRAILLFVVIAVSRSAAANGNDLPQEIVVQGFVKLEDGRAEALVRVPLILLSNLTLPKRGPGYLDLANIEPRLRQAAALVGRQVELSSSGATLTPLIREMQLALPFDRSFASYSMALAHIQGPPLPVTTDIFATQGYFDVHFEYTLPANATNLWIRLNVPPEVAQRIRLRVDYLAADAPPRPFEISGDLGWVPLDPRWYEAGWFFVKLGFIDAFAVDRLVFLLALVAPFRSFRGAVALAIMFAALQALTLTASAEGALSDLEVGWLPLLCNCGLAASMVLLAIGNLAVPTLRRRWLISAVAGALAGFGLGRLLSDAAPFAGTHSLVAVASFDVGVVFGTIVSAVIAFAALRLVFRRILGPPLGVVVLSAVIGHVAWHGMMDNAGELWRLLGRVPPANLWPAFSVVAMWLAPAVLVGAVAYSLLKRWNGEAVRTLLDAMQASDAARPTRT